MKKHSTVVEDYFQNTIKKSWTWERLTEEEQKRFIDMTIFDRIRGNDQTRVAWLNTIYFAFISALGYKPIGEWRETAEEKEILKF